MSLPSSFYLLAFLLYISVEFLLTHLADFVAERLQLLTGRARPFLIRLRFFDFSYRVLYLSVSCSNYLVCLSLCLPNDFLSFASQLLNLFLVLLDGLHHLLLLRVNRLPFALPIAFVARDVEQILIGINILTANEFRSIGNHFLGNANLACNLDCETAPRITYLQLEERCHLLTVVEHGSVHDSRRVFGKVLEVLIVRRDDGKGLFLDETFQYGFRNRTANRWLRSASKLVY